MPQKKPPFPLEDIDLRKKYLSLVAAVLVHEEGVKEFYPPGRVLGASKIYRRRFRLKDHWHAIAFFCSETGFARYEKHKRQKQDYEALRNQMLEGLTNGPFKDWTELIELPGEIRGWKRWTLFIWKLIYGFLQLLAGIFLR